MSRRQTQVHKNMVRKLILDSKFYLEAADAVMFDNMLSEVALEMLERRSLDMIAAVQQYRQATRPLFTQGQKS